MALKDHEVWVGQEVNGVHTITSTFLLFLGSEHPLPSVLPRKEPLIRERVLQLVALCKP
jgi:hypothetical protein